MEMGMEMGMMVSGEEYDLIVVLPLALPLMVKVMEM